MIIRNWWKRCGATENAMTDVHTVPKRGGAMQRVQTF